MLKLVIFDWDGTLADSVSKIIECKKFLANKFALPLPNDETVKSVLGTKFEDALVKCFPDASTNIIKEVAQEFHDLMKKEHYQAMLFPGANAVLDELKKRGIKLAIATSKDRTELDTALIYNNLSDKFDITCCGKEYQEKPNPAMLIHIMDKLNVQPEECVMIGDTITDVLFAKNADVRTICVSFGAHSITTLETVEPLAIIKNWEQLIEVIDRLCYLNQPSYRLLLQRA